MMSINASGEMYLESILVLSKTKSAVRSIDIAEHMNFSKPSVSRAVGILKRNGYIEIDPNGHITLTNEGLSLAQNVFERHTVISRMLVMLGVDEQTAAEDACKIEHVISQRSFEALKKYLENV